MNEEGDNTVEITTIDWTDTDMKEKCKKLDSLTKPKYLNSRCARS